MSGFIPKVEFDIAPINEQAELFYSFYIKKDRFRGYFDTLYPELKNVIQDSKSKSENLARCKIFTEQTIEAKKQNIQESLKSIQEEWDVINDSFLHTLSKHFETDWPEDKKVIKGYVSILPIFPRFLSAFSFYVGLRNVKNEIETTAHEIVHFLWFKKWKEVFPETPTTEYEAPHLVWRLSEVMDPIILQCHPEIKELIKPKNWGYESFKNVKIGEVGMTEHFTKLYTDCVNAGKSFKEILRICWVEAQKYEKEISSF